MPFLKTPLIAMIKIYQRYISILLPQSCRFFPSCSQYSLEAVEKYGSVRGIFKSLMRLGKCHPFHPGGYDPVR